MCIWDSLQASPVPLSLNLPCPHPPHNNVPTPLPSLHPDNDATLQSHPHPCLHPCHHQPPPHCHCYLTSPLPSSLHCSCHHLSVIITLTFIILALLLPSSFCHHHSHLHFCLVCCHHHFIIVITAMPSLLSSSLSPLFLSWLLLPLSYHWHHCCAILPSPSLPMPLCLAHLTLPLT